MQPDVSFIIPVFNKQLYLRQCVESVLGQTLAYAEIICIDDNSQDQSREILREAAEQDPRVRLIFNERNLGAGLSRNRGLEAASGRYIRLVDADDLLPPNSTEAMFRRAVETGADLVRGALTRFVNDDPNDSSLMVRTPDRPESTFECDRDLWVPWWHTSYLIAADLIRDHAISYPELRRGEDPVFMAQVLSKSGGVSLIEDVVYLYRAYPKTTGSAGDTFADAVDSLHHAARVKAIYLERCQKAWTEGYGPFLLEDFRKYIGRCRFDEEQAAFVNAEAEKIWGMGTVLAEAVPAQATGGSEALGEKDYWNHLFRREDPWNYTGAYEQTKYRHTLELLPTQDIANALEIGCAEGLFTAMLAPRTRSLLAVDISAAALARARNRCAGMLHVSFLEHDIANGVPGDGYDLIVCSEILYYLRDSDALAAFARRVRESLGVGGHLVMTHANMVSDDRNETGFDFNEIGVKFIGEAFAGCDGLEFVRELRTDLYRVQLFRRSTEARVSEEATVPREVLLREHADFFLPSIKWGGCAMTAAEARHLWRVRDVPVLMYHRVADDGPDALAPYRVSPADFERQLAWLQRHGWHGMDLGGYCKRRFSEGRQEIPGKPVILTFDDAYVDFYRNAWPLLRKYGFPATVFIPTEFVGGCADWDAGFGPPAPIMSWEQMAELQREGVAFGSHSCAHRRVWEMEPAELLSDAIRSKKTIEERLGAPISGYCYPFAAADPNSRRIIKEAGYEWAVCGRGGNPPERNDPRYIPRIEVFGNDLFERFVSCLPVPEPTGEEQRQRYFELKARRDRATYMGL